LPLLTARPAPVIGTEHTDGSAETSLEEREQLPGLLSFGAYSAPAV